MKEGQVTLKRVPGTQPTARSLWLLPDGPGGALSSLCVHPGVGRGFYEWVGGSSGEQACTQPWDRVRDGCCQTVADRRSREGPPTPREGACSGGST